MTEDMAFFPLWMLLLASFGFAIGWALGDEVRRRKNAEERVEDLREQLKHSAITAQLREIRSVNNDAHKHILAVSKGLQKQAH
jgi:hypothetical protein